MSSNLADISMFESIGNGAGAMAPFCAVQNDLWANRPAMPEDDLPFHNATELLNKFIAQVQDAYRQYGSAFRNIMDDLPASFRQNNTPPDPNDDHEVDLFWASQFYEFFDSGELTPYIATMLFG